MSRCRLASILSLVSQTNLIDRLISILSPIHTSFLVNIPLVFVHWEVRWTSGFIQRVAPSLTPPNPKREWMTRSSNTSLINNKLERQDYHSTAIFVLDLCSPKYEASIPIVLYFRKLQKIKIT
jgi:hypothetical protein